MVAIDVRCAAVSLEALIKDPNLRKRLGLNGRRRAQETFDWKVVISHYRDLWSDLAARRDAARDDYDLTGTTAVDPSRLCPFKAFEKYATATITPDAIVSQINSAQENSIEDRIRLRLVSFARTFMPTHYELERLFDKLSRDGPLRASEIYEEYPSDRRAIIERGLIWLCKLDLIQIRLPGSDGHTQEVR
jgi:hypothetical protein